MDHKLVIKNIKEGRFDKIYFLHGEEPFFIDQITDAIIEHSMEDHERDFNQVILYGKEAEPLSLISELKGYPMMGQRKLVVLKEAQEFKQLDQLESYCENPSDTTIFVINYKYKTYDSRKKIIKSATKNGLLFKSEKIKDYLMSDWVQTQVKSSGYTISSKACMLLIESIGNDLNRIVNEIEKLSIILEKGTAINDVHIEENIGISKDYNVFELTNALAQRDLLKALKIVDYFEHNPKATDMVVVVANLFKFFTQLMRIHFLPNKSKEAVANSLKLHPYVAGELINASRNFNPKVLARNVELLYDYDLKSKGVGSTGAVGQGDLMREMVFQLIN
jgi:DNA polymerase-3 subunit delta